MKRKNKNTSFTYKENSGISVSDKSVIKGDINQEIHNEYTIYQLNTSYEDLSYKKLGKEYDLLKLEEISKESILQSSLMPWHRSFGISFESFFHNNYCIDSLVQLASHKQIFFSQFERENKKKKCIFLGEAGAGKSFLMKMHCINLLNAKKHAIYVCAEDWKIDSDIVSYIKDVLNQTIIPPNDLLLIIDGIDELFANNYNELGKLISQTSSLNCGVWLGCRTNFYNSAKCLESIPYEKVVVQSWNPTQAYNFVKNYSIITNNSNIITKYTKMPNAINGINSFSKNPLQLSMLVYIIECDRINVLLQNNEYLLYKNFFEIWVNNELLRLENNKYDEEYVFSEWAKTARELYTDSKRESKIQNIPILTSIIKSTISNKEYCNVSAFWHRSFMEYILAKEAIDSMLQSSQAVIQKLKNNNRSDIDFYIKKAFFYMSYLEKNTIIENLITAYNQVEKDLNNEIEMFYVQNQIIYYLTRMNSSSNAISEFIKKKYFDEKRPIMRQGMAYGAANIGLWEIALAFAKEMRIPNSDANRINRAWTLIFYGDQPDEDPLNYEDTHNSLWERSKNARLRRLSGCKSKDRAFRMFDLCILHGFYESRNWEGLTLEELKIIEGTETKIVGYLPEVVEFLTEKKAELVEDYKKNLNIV